MHKGTVVPKQEGEYHIYPSLPSCVFKVLVYLSHKDNFFLLLKAGELINDMLWTPMLGLTGPPPPLWTVLTPWVATIGDTLPLSLGRVDVFVNHEQNNNTRLYA